MKLIELHITNIGPFVDFKIKIDPEVTVITGRNDAGKSSLLKAIRMVCAKVPDELIGESEVSLERLTKPTVAWEDDPELQCKAVFEGDFAGKPARGTYDAFLAPKKWKESTLKLEGHELPMRGSRALNVLPKIAWVGTKNRDGIRQQLYLNDLNETEKKFIGIAFGADFSWEAFVGYSPSIAQIAISKAEDRLNNHLQKVLPNSLPYRFKLQSPSDEKKLLYVSITDEHGCLTALGMRGSGVQKIVELLGLIAIENLGKAPTILILDEPETSLHADAQHTLRRTLEELGRSSNIQVIYATHSPCMVNSMKPQTLRLLKRVPHGGSAITVVEDDPFAGNYALVRSSLGMSPADSLLYAPVTVVVSGRTEIRCLPEILRRLEEGRVSGFEDVTNILSSSIFIDSDGDGNVSNLCRIAQAQGSKVVAFCDGDTGNRWKNQVEKLIGNQSVILPDGWEFENLLPKETYFSALATYLDKEVVTLAAWETWIEHADLPSKMAFTKKVSRWLTDKLQLRDLDKPDVMFAAVKTVSIDGFELEPLKKLIAIMRGCSMDNYPC